MNPFDFVKAINKGGPDLIADSDNPELAEKDYIPFIINKTFSQHIDTILLANELNGYHHLDNALQNTFYLNTVRPKNRFAKWAKPAKFDDLECVKQYYGYSNRKALQALELLTPSALAKIKTKLEKGGTK